MQLIDNYLAAVAGYLPKRNRRDIAAELKSTLYDQFEDKSASLQRELTADDEAEFLKGLGHPFKVAAQYLPQQYLIGPGLFHYYLYALRMIGLIVVGIHVALSVVLGVATGDWLSSFADLVSRVLTSLFVVAGAATIVFAVMERTGRQLDWFDKWDPSRLKTQTLSQPVDRGSLIADVIADIILFLWWIGIISFERWLEMGNNQLSITMSPEFGTLFWPVSLILACSIVLHLAMLAYGRWRALPITIELVLGGAAIAVLGYIMQMDHPIRLEFSADLPAEKLQYVADRSMQVFFYFVAAMVAIDLFKHVRIAYRLARSAA